MSKPLMNPHGRWVVTRVGNVLVQTNAGHFNEEGVLGAFADMRAAMPTTGPWAVLVDARHWNMASERSLELIFDFRKLMFESGCTVNACVIPPGLRNEIHQKFSGGFSREKLRYFQSLEDACDWLTACGFPISVTQYPHHDFVIDPVQY
jgi:hypothetical protein